MKQGQDLTGSRICGYMMSTSPEVICGAVAAGHFMWDDSGDNGLACEAHCAWAMAHAIDWHPIGHDCTMPGADWHFSTGDGAGFCSWPLTPELVEAEALGALA